MKKFFYILLVAVILTNCSEYHKVLKAPDIGAKFKVGEKLYNEGKYEKANKLFAQIVPNYRGKPQAEKLMYLYSNSFYKMEDYYVAGYQFERFASSYPRSEKVEEASFLAVKSYYMLSPVYSKSQTETKEAIEKLQEFINIFPDSNYLDEANEMMRELVYKLEKKAFEIAKQYNTISDYEACMRSFENFVFEYPGSTLREDALFYRLDSAYKLAVNSVERKRQERLEIAKDYNNTFKKSYANSKHIVVVDEMAVVIDEQLNEYSSKS